MKFHKKGGGLHVVAITQKIVEGKHGLFVICLCDNVEGSITFTLDKDVWRENTHPENGVYVVLDDLQRKRSGWRAMKARYYRPEDEANSKTEK